MQAIEIFCNEVKRLCLNDAKKDDFLSESYLLTLGKVVVLFVKKNNFFPSIPDHQHVRGPRLAEEHEDLCEERLVGVLQKSFGLPEGGHDGGLDVDDGGDGGDGGATRELWIT